MSRLHDYESAHRKIRRLLELAQVLYRSRPECDQLATEEGRHLRTRIMVYKSILRDLPETGSDPGNDPEKKEVTP